MNKQQLKCLFGHHEYVIKSKTKTAFLICKYCKRSGQCICTTCLTRVKRGEHPVQYDLNEQGDRAFIDEE